MAGIFICYRRADAEGWAGRLSDSMRAELGRVNIFRDIENIPPGVEFDAYINDAVGSCAVLIVLIGPRWLTVRDKNGVRRLDDPEDFTRLEILAALKRNVRVIPALVGDARMPGTDELPEDIKSLARRQAYELSDIRWAEDCHRLAKVLRPIVTPSRLRKIQVAVVALIALIVGGFGVKLWNNHRAEIPRQEPNRVATERKEDPFLKASELLKKGQYDQARSLYAAAADNGDARAMYNLGYMYEYGKGVAQDFVAARQWYEKAAAAGNASAMDELGRRYQEGLGVAKDTAIARQWYEKAAALGDVGAMKHLAEIYSEGGAVAEDWTTLRLRLEKAADLGNTQAMTLLAAMYAKGVGVAEDRTTALHWFEKAADLGDVAAMVVLGEMYQDGAVVAKNLITARQWYEKAAARGSETAKTRLQQIK